MFGCRNYAPEMFRKDLGQNLLYFLRKMINFLRKVIKNIFLILASLCFVGIIVILYYSRSVLPWCLWKHICMDTFTVLALPVLLGLLSAHLKDINDFCKYEDLMRCPRDVRMYAWKGTHYYDQFEIVDERLMSIAFDPFERYEEVERETEEEEVERETVENNINEEIERETVENNINEAFDRETVENIINEEIERETEENNINENAD